MYQLSRIEEIERKRAYSIGAATRNCNYEQSEVEYPAFLQNVRSAVSYNNICLPECAGFE
jgi:hypothetical protein